MKKFFWVLMYLVLVLYFNNVVSVYEHGNLKAYTLATLAVFLELISLYALLSIENKKSSEAFRLGWWPMATGLLTTFTTIPQEMYINNPQGDYIIGILSCLTPYGAYIACVVVAINAYLLLTADSKKIASLLLLIISIIVVITSVFA
ncbi:hypothetical protein BCU90_23815 [Vibrio lentus]|uniref:hypothetical protein n=1 Tax=Vibrio TaxID=662 RepID=UPI000C820943|nr:MULTISPECIES: hypothetical protein [Vibrio]PMG43926.1 hypothetical protein BCU90_23815 [Vibrio lentus]TKE97883.1 hypothetical protein FCV46_20730 [Vibrio kanaloae]TKF52446.1 hypothetical protein FCV51_21285 [Vibrio kanaloae]